MWYIDEGRREEKINMGEWLGGGGGGEKSKGD